MGARAPPIGCHAQSVDEVRRRDDDELCGHIEYRHGRWCALAVFGAVLGTHDSCDAAKQQLLDEGLASLAERWSLRNGETGDEEVVCIQEAHTSGVTVARGYYSLPGVPTLTITAQQIASGEWEMHR
jgi:hypothetical protein